MHKTHKTHIVYIHSNMNLPNSKKYIVANENYNEPMGYVVKYCQNRIFATFWVFTDNNEQLFEKQAYFYSLRHLYSESVTFVNSALIDYSPLHKSKYKMMCDFIAHYENNYTDI